MIWSSRDAQPATCNCVAGPQGLHSTGCGYPVTCNIIYGVDVSHCAYIKPKPAEPPPAWLKQVWRRHRLRF